MFIRLDAAEWVPATNERGEPVRPIEEMDFPPVVMVSGTVNGRPVHFELVLRYMGGQWSGNVHSGIDGWTDYEVEGMVEV